MNENEIVERLKEQLYPALAGVLLDGRVLEHDRVETLVNAYLSLLGPNNLDNQVKHRVMSNIHDWIANFRLQVTVDVPHGIVGPENARIVKVRDAKHPIDWQAWSRYKLYLQVQKNFPVTVTRAIEQSTREIINRMPDPRSNESFDCRGMVMGDVQSGKTANYAGLLARAADAGYRVVVVAAGGTNSLRRQTQMRLERDFADICTDPNAPRNASRVGAFGNVPYVLVNWTTVDNDFVGNGLNVNYAALNDNNLVFMVIKKNGTVLRRIIEAFQAMRNQNPRAFQESALLFVDDEADYASVNGNDNDELPAVINRHIRTILGMFNKSAYVGYTATPFANVFIDPDPINNRIELEDLFPRDFIYSLGSPSNYQGGAKLFLDADGRNNTIQSIDAEDELIQRLRGGEPVTMPDSMEDALCSYILAHAIVRVRYRYERMKFTGMLIHVHREREPHNAIYNLVHAKLQSYKDEMVNNADVPLDSEIVPHLVRLRKVWDQQYKDKQNPDSTVPWDEVRVKMCQEDFLDELRVVVVNAENEMVDYAAYDRAGIIYIGGDKLARGLTIEGLVTTYFLRKSRQYDSLMQMGRWFGYRPGYEDICRVFMTDELRLYYSEIATSIEELKYDLLQMENRNLTPRDFGLKVRNNISGLLVTGAAKMRAANTIQQYVSMSGGFLFTNSIPADDNRRNRINEIFRSFIGSLHTEIGVTFSECLNRNAFMWELVPARRVLNFLREIADSGLNIYKIGTYCLSSEQPVRDALTAEGYLDVSLVRLARQNDAQSVELEIGGEPRQVTFGLRRTASLNRDGMFTFTKNNSTSPSDERGGLTDSEIAAWLRENEKDNNYQMSRSDYRACRGAKRNRPLLILTGYFVGSSDIEGEQTAPKFVSACGLSFPSSASAENGHQRIVNYVYNPVALRQLEEQEGED